MKPREIAALRQKRSSGGGGGTTYTAPTRQSVTITTSSLATGATWTGTVALAKAYRLYSISTNRACRTRVYTDASARSADASRPVGTDPTDGAGLVLEFVSTAALLSATLSPTVDGFSGESPATSSIPVSITNNGATGAVEVTLTFLATEV